MIDTMTPHEEVFTKASEVRTDIHEINSRIETPDAPEKKTERPERRIGSIENPRYIITRNECLKGERHPVTGVKFESKVVETPSGEYIEGVFPKFESVFKAEISKDLYEKSDASQFKECNKQLLAKIEKDPELKEQFSEDQINQIKEGISDGSAPDGYVWHHEPESGKISLVDSEIHAMTGHTGGRAIWGGGSDNR